MTTSIDGSVRLTSLSPGAGCACKLPLASLEELFASLGPLTQPLGGELLVGLDDGDDAAVYRLDDERALILTTDFFTPIVDSPFDWGRVSATNALSDVYAMGGRPLLALNLAAWPNADLPIEMLGEVMRGAAKAAKEAGCAVVGGHTIDDPVPKYGMAVVGLAHPDRLLSIDKANPGDELVLTKPIGTGVIATAVKRGSPRPEAVRASIDAMTTLNAAAGQAAIDAGVRAATDVTGFGLLGHLHRMARASGVAAEVTADRVPILPDARELVAEGFVSGGTRANMTHLRDMVLVEPGVDEELSVLLHDAQTSGGLLMCAPVPTDRLLDDLREHGVPASVIGRVVDGGQGHITVR